MGIDCVNFQRLVELAAQPDRVAVRRGVMLGRQTFRYQVRRAKWYRRWLVMHEVDATVDSMIAEDGFSEKFFETMGFGAVESMDFSDYEGATLVHDLNTPVPKELHGQFDFIYDGGTIEHVFDTPQALRNVFDMLKEGGLFVSANGLNGWLFHGLYQFNPELVWSFWKNMAGCEVVRCLAMPETPDVRPIPLPDVSASGRRLRVPDFPQGRVYLYYEVRKTPGASLGGSVLQSDYRARWSRAETPDLEDA